MFAFIIIIIIIITEHMYFKYNTINNIHLRCICYYCTAAYIFLFQHHIIVLRNSIGGK
jgi:hypothetical protein